MKNGGTTSMGNNGTKVRESTYSTDFHSTQVIAACSPIIDFFLLGMFFVVFLNSCQTL